MERRSRVATLAALLGGLAAADLVLGPILSHLVSPMTGFALIFPLGAAAALGAVVLGVVGWFLTAPGRARGRGRAGFAIAAGAGFLLLLGALNAGNLAAPPINDITTDLEDPPVFRAALRAEANAGRDMSYPEEFVLVVRDAYPDLAPIAVAAPPAEALARAKAAAESLGWEVVEVREDTGELEARQTSAVFAFVDDVVVRVRPADGGSRVDVRSKSRDGRGDLGANAARIRAFRDAVGS